MIDVTVTRMRDLRLETERLVLRKPTPADAARMAVFGGDNRDHFAPLFRPDRTFRPPEASVVAKLCVEVCHDEK